MTSLTTFNNNVSEIKRKLAILQEISSSNLLTDNLSTIVNIMLELAVNYTGAEKGSVMLINNKGELYIYASRGIDIAFVKAYKVKIGEGIAGYVAKTGKPLLVQDIEEDKRFKKLSRYHYKTRSFISCPIISKNKILGVFNINDKKNGQPFTTEDLEFVKIISNQAAISIENALLIKKLHAKAEELEELNKKLIESDLVKTEFITRISHELRTPLNSIKGSIYYLKETKDITRSEQKEFYEIISNETDKLISIVENLLNFLRLEDELKLIDKTIVSLEEVLNEITSSGMLSRFLKEKNIKLNINFPSGIPTIVADKVRATQLFVNLIEWLSEYLKDNDTINIEVKKNDFIDVIISIPHRLPEEVAYQQVDLKSVIIENLPEERLKFYLANRIADAHKWKINTENSSDGFSLTIKIPESARNRINAIVNSCLNRFIDLVSEVLDVNICSIMLSDELTGDLVIRGAKGLNEDVIKRTRLKLGDKIAGWVALEGKPLLIENIEEDPRFAKRNISQYNTKSLLSLPVKIDDQVVGVLNLNNKRSKEPFNKIDYYIANELSLRISNFLKHLYSEELTEEDIRHFMTTLENLVFIQRKYYKRQPLLPTLMMSVLEELGADEKTKSIGVYVSVFYDLGLMTVDESVLKKKRILASEKRSLKIHPFTTVSLLNNFEFSGEVKKAILHHHENYDGSGYPDGLKGKEIPFLSRVLSVVDSYCAMISDRPYRKALSKSEALRELKEMSGKIYDPEIVEALERVVTRS